jgi:hypothetical protein
MLTVKSSLTIENGKPLMIVKMTGVLSTGEAVAGTIEVTSLFMALILTVRDWVITSVLMVIFKSKVLSRELKPKGLV